MNKPQVDFESYGREFKIKSKQFLDSIESLTKKQLERVLKALTLFPLEHEKIKLTHREETLAFDLGVEIFTAKVNMTVAYIGEHAKVGTEMINDAEGDTSEERVANAKISANKLSDEATLKDKVENSVELPTPPVKEIKEIVKKKKKTKVKKDEV